MTALLAMLALGLVGIVAIFGGLILAIGYGSALGVLMGALGAYCVTRSFRIGQQW